MKKLLILFIILAGCSTKNNEIGDNFFDFKFSDKMSLKEFQIKLEDYSINSAYPNIDN